MDAVGEEKATTKITKPTKMIEPRIALKSRTIKPGIAVKIFAMFQTFITVNPVHHRFKKIAGDKH